MSVAAAVHQKAITLAKLALRMTAKAGSRHPSSFFYRRFIAEAMRQRVCVPDHPGAVQEAGPMFRN